MSSPCAGLGVLFRATNESDLVGLAKEVEARGFDALALGEHTHIPVGSNPADFPGGDDGIPRSYARLLDPYISLAWVAATTTLKVATATSLPAEHDPIALAKSVATLDHLSGGRLTFGVGFGWNVEEMANHGWDFADRRGIVREVVELMRELWTADEAEYRGRHVSLERSWMWPKPANGHIPVLLGVAGGELGMRAIVEWGDGWMPGGPPEWLGQKLAELRHRWEAAGRGGHPTVWVMHDARADGERARSAIGALRELEVDQILVSFHGTDYDEVLPVLDRYADLVAP